MNGIFDFMFMPSHEERAIDRFESEDCVIDTCAVTDSDQPYETGVCHKLYNDGKWVIVEMYDTGEEAEIGHKKWVKKMTAKRLPQTLRDVSTCGLAKMLNAMDEKGLSFDKQAGE